MNSNDSRKPGKGHDYSISELSLMAELVVVGYATEEEERLMLELVESDPQVAAIFRDEVIRTALEERAIEKLEQKTKEFRSKFRRLHGNTPGSLHSEVNLMFREMAKREEKIASRGHPKTRKASHSHRHLPGSSRKPDAGSQ